MEPSTLPRVKRQRGKQAGKREEADRGKGGGERERESERGVIEFVASAATGESTSQ